VNRARRDADNSNMVSELGKEVSVNNVICWLGSWSVV